MMWSMGGEKMEDLKNKEGKEFEEAYLKTMMKQRKMDMEMMKMAQEKATDPKILDMTKRMMDCEMKEMDEMEKMKGMEGM